MNTFNKKSNEKGIKWAHRGIVSDLQFFDLTTGPLEARIEELIENLKTREME